ncbi:MAG TPA: cupredoxin domain-containing protein [Sphingomicrobium sp.]
MIASRVAALAALSLMSAAPAAAQPAAMTIYVWSYNFAPKPIYLRANRPVTLTFVNRSGSSHDFTAHDFFSNSRIMRGDAAEGEIELRGHETKSVTLVPRAGTYHAHCSHFMHKQLGMNDLIVVN